MKRPTSISEALRLARKRYADGGGTDEIVNVAPPTPLGFLDRIFGKEQPVSYGRATPDHARQRQRPAESRRAQRELEKRRLRRAGLAAGAADRGHREDLSDDRGSARRSKRGGPAAFRLERHAL